MGPVDLSAVSSTFESLWDSTSPRELKPRLAESVDIDEKGLTITFHLRNGIRFDDGGTRAIIEIFRLEDGKIDEHWDIVQAIKEQTANPNGMF